MINLRCKMVLIGFIYMVFIGNILFRSSKSVKLTDPVNLMLKQSLISLLLLRVLLTNTWVHRLIMVSEIVFLSLKVVFYQICKYETRIFEQRIHVYCMKMFKNILFEVLSIASYTFFPPVWQLMDATRKKLSLF